MRTVAQFVVIFLAAGLLACEQPASTISSNDTFVAPEVQFAGLFEAVQLGGVFEDSKTFVDCTPRAPVADIMSAYKAEKEQPDFSLAEFVATWFDPPISYSSDFVADTSKTVQEHINSLWPVLTRNPDEQQAGSLIPLPHPYIVPGGRFGEIYYWDSYFTMLGLSVSDKHQAMIRSMVDNFTYLIDTLGFIPNGNRSYFLGRSQPPFFSLMVRLLAETDESVTLADYLLPMEEEYQFWTDGALTLNEGDVYRRLVQLPGGAIMNRYWDNRPEPRPESYREDVHLAEANPDRDAVQLYRDLRAACESGWDFSSRWLEDSLDLGTIRTTEIIPVDLNALLWHLEHTLAEAAAEAGFQTKATDYAARAEARKMAILEYCWNETNGRFEDYRFTENRPTGKATLAMMFPLFFELATEEQATSVAAQIEADFLAPGGLRTTLVRSGQQWDAPNGWAPLQYISIVGLRNYGHHTLADVVEQRWTDLNRQVYKQTGKLTEKYDVSAEDKEAGGGEYPVQDGFGWTNGVLLRLLTPVAEPVSGA